MNRLIKLFALIFAVTLFVSCDREALNMGSGDDNGVEGTLNLSSFKIGINLGEVEVVTRAVSVNNFMIDLYKEGIEAPYKQWKYSEMPEVISLPVGSYQLRAYSHVQEDVAWDVPYYFAAENFDIVKGKYTDLGTMICKLKSIKTSVKFDDALIALMDDATKVNLLTNEKGSLDFDKTTTERNGHFKALNDVDNIIKTTFVGTVDGQKVNFTKTFSNVKAGEHRIFKYALKESGGDLGDNGDPNISISVDVSCEVIDETVVVDPGEEDNIGDEGNNELPTIIGTSLNGAAFDFDVTHTIANGGCTLLVDITAQQLLSDVEITIASETLTTDALAGLGLTSHFSLANPGQYEAGIINIGLPVGNSVIDQTGLKLDISKLTTMLGSVNRANHQLTIKVTDKGGNVLAKTLTLITEAQSGGSNDLPTIVGANFNGAPFDIDGSHIVPMDGCTLIVDINAPKLLADVEVTIDSETLTPEILTGVGLTDKFSLAHPGEYETGLSGLGFPVGNDVIGQSALQFNISQFTALLGIYGAATHKFIIKVTDKDGNIQTKTLTLISEGEGGSESNDLPTIVGANFNDAPFDIDGSHIVPTDGCTLIVDINAPKLLADVEVTIDSETLTPEILTGVGLTDKFSLAYPAQYEEGLSGLGFPVGNDVIGQSALQFNISQFTGLLGIYGTATHKFIIKATDQSNNVITKTLTLITE